MGRVLACCALAIVPPFLATAAPAAAQQPVPPADSAAVEDPFAALPPLPDSLALYGDTLAVGFDLPSAAPPPGALALSLEEAVRLALAESPGLGIAALEAQRAANDATRANAGYYPTLDATGQLAGSGNLALAGGDDAPGASSGLTSATADVTLGYTVFDGGRRGATLERLRTEAARLGLSAEAEAEALAFAVTAAYLDVVRQEGLVSALEEAVALSEDRLRIEQAEVRIGTAAEVDAALALSDLNADRAALLRQVLFLTQARATLGALLALPEPEAVAVTDTLALGPPPDLPALAAEAEAGNRRLRALALAEDAAEAAVREVQAEFAPSVRLLTGVGVGAADRGLFPAGDPGLGTDVRYGVTATLPLFDAGDRRRRVENARLRVRQAELATEDERAFLRADVARLTAAVTRYRQLAALEDQNRAVARANARVALAQLQLGFISPVDLRQVQIALLDAETRYVDAVFQARRAEAELRLLAGDLLPEGGAD